MIMSSWERDGIGNREEAADTRCPATILAEKEESERPSPVVGRTGMTGEGLIRLADFAAAHPDAWATAREKIMDPGASCRELAERLGISRRTVGRHILASVEAVPEISVAILNKRKGAA